MIDNAPERHGALPDGGVIGIGANVHAAPVAGYSLSVRPLGPAAFMLLYLSLVVIWIGASIPFVHLVPYAEDHGLSHGTAVTIFGLVGIGSIAGRFLLGGIADRVGLRMLLAAIFAGIALTQLWWLIATSAWQLVIFAFVFGVCYGGFVALYPALTVGYFGSRNASSIIGVLYTGGAAGSFLGPKLAGDAFDWFGSYTIPIAVGAACALLAVAFVIAAPEPDLPRGESIKIEKSPLVFFKPAEIPPAPAPRGLRPTPAHRETPARPAAACAPSPARSHNALRQRE